MKTETSCFGPCPRCGRATWIVQVPLTCISCGYVEPLRFDPIAF